MPCSWIGGRGHIANGMGFANLRNNTDGVDGRVKGSKLASNVPKLLNVSANRSKTIAGSDIISTSLLGTKLDIASAAITEYWGEDAFS